MNNLLVLLIAHAMGDFYFQSDAMAQKKNSIWKYLISHCLIYSFFTIVGVLILKRNLNLFQGIIMILSMSLMHFLVDLLLPVLAFKFCEIYKKFKKTDEPDSEPVIETNVDSKQVRVFGLKSDFSKFQSLVLFIVDQIIHFIIIFLSISCVIGKIDFNVVNKVILLIFIVVYAGMPSAILIEKVVSLVDTTKNSNSDEGVQSSEGLENSNEDNEDATTNGLYEDMTKDGVTPSGLGESIAKYNSDTGTVIGIIERLLIVVLALSSSINSIAIIVATKTMVRYGQFDNADDFRTKYLIGTLTSILVGVSLYLFYKVWF